MWDFPLFPEPASTAAAGVDIVYFVLVGLSIFFSALVFSFIIFLAIRYRQGANVDRSKPLFESGKLEFAWSFIPLVLALGVFAWQAKMYFDLYKPPADAMEIYVVGKQWMWKIQHPEGQREVNELHIPIGRPVRLIMTSQDVIHSFYVPAFRIKQDVLPGRYTSIWFEATKTGRYHLFCAEYCGTDHSTMIGSVVVMEEADYQQWLTDTAAGTAPTSGAGTTAGQPMASAGEALYDELGCATCHRPDGGGVGPSLVDLYNQTVQLTSGETVTADEEYVRESIVNPSARVKAGYNDVMPTFQGQVSEEELQQLVVYIKSLSSDQGSEQQ